MPLLAHFRRVRRPRLPAVRRAVAVVLVLAALALAVHAPEPPVAPTVPVLVAARDLAPGVTLRSADVRVVRSPSALRPSSALTRVEEASGHVLAGAAGAGEPITHARLVGAKNSHLTTGDRAAVAVPVRLADPAVATLLTPGARVDVVTASAEGMSPVVLATNAVVVTVREPPSRDEDRLVVLAAPEEAATRLAAVSLHQPVAVTLR